MSAPTESASSKASKFSVFNMKANQKIQSELVAQHEHDAEYIADLEMFVMENGLRIPDDLKKKGEVRHVIGEKEAVMQDGSLDALAKSMARVKPHSLNYEIKVQYRNLTFWNNMPKRTIPTVGSAVKELFLGSGKKERVDIVKNLTGRILPGRMTLVVGPPGCGKSIYYSFSTFSAKECLNNNHVLTRQDDLPQGSGRPADHRFRQPGW